MNFVRAMVSAILVLSPIWSVQQAVAQVPPHTPGTICFTPQFWCWANPPGKPGAPCICPSPYGPVRGTLN